MSLASLLSASPQAHSVVSRENETEPAPASAPWRRRGSRACDKCSFSRTRCNGGCPCHQYLRTDSSAEASQPRHGAIYFGSPTSERLSETNGELPTVATTSITTPSSSDPPTAIASSTAHRSNFEPCKYPVLIPLLPILANIIPVSVACDLLRLYFDRPGSSMLKCASPYVLTHVLRRRALLHPSHPRVTSPALILAMLHATAHTADLDCFHVPGSRAAACDKLYVAAIEQLNDCERWHRLPSGRWVVPDGLSKHNNAEASTGSTERDKYEVNDQCSSSDDLLAMILVTIVISGGTFKADCLRWWGKALRLARVLQLAGLDKESRVESKSQTFFEFEAAEERRRIFWLLFCLDRHLALSYNAPLAILDSDVSVYLPLPETTWNDPDLPNLPIPNGRVYGPRTTISGTGFFEFFLPLMTILGDIVLLHHRRLHPRLSALSDAAETAAVESLLRECEQSLAELRNNAASGDAHSGKKTTPHTSSQLVAAYSTHILHVLSVLLYGKWDPITMLTATPASFINSPSMGEDSDDWITPDRFMKCTSHAVAASQAVDAIITLDPELVFMPYLFGIYLLQGSFILLLFADRMPQLGGPNPEVEMACETIIRAHEICVVTLTTEFQRSFRRVLRSTLYSVRNAAPCDPEEAQARRNALAMYRWTRGGRGLAL
ncbi:hypothetical protein OIDMADRAFT_45276 [Oidiodendron maius Zn]|uniref:Xylanolytic transcriptional activator regulatory domain-containing protein n=1 Tax=Oidiodendron maius (strain Zn) TaxID=913774 RepID=A0A0C3GH09_OIDMZ|nr:hypothetical protein OIDMADRAFT_45276 [Oidiodendron maius Zn]